jgi:signal transduction histidine kinase/AraC-like DNA-binding protein/streptogramin lyase
MRRTVYIVLATILALLPGSEAVAQYTMKYKVSRLTMADGLPSNTIRAMAEDSKGFIWLGGTNGLSRYDGYQFVPFNGFGDFPYKSQHVGLLNLQPSSQWLWAITSTFSYGCFNLAEQRFIPYRINGKALSGFYKQFESSQGLWLYDNKSGACHPQIVDGEPQVVVLNEKNGLLPSNNVTAMAEDSRHHIWLATNKGLVMFDGKKAHWQLRGKSVLDCLRCGPYIVALCNLDRTFFLFGSDGRMVTSLPIPESIMGIGKLNSSLVWQGQCLYFSPTGCLSLNIAKRTISRPDELQIPLGFLQGQAGGYQMVGSRKGIVLILPDKGSPLKLKLSDQLQSTNEKNKIYDLAYDSHSGLLYIASYGMGLFVLNPRTGNLQQYTAQDANPLVFSNYLLGVFIDHTGTIWVSGESTGLSRIQPIANVGATYYYIDSHRKGDWTNFMRYVFLDKTGQTCVATKDSKLHSLDLATGKFKTLFTLPSVIHHYMVDSKGHEWVSTFGSGLYIDGVMYALGDEKHPLPTRDFNCTVEDARHRIWVATWGAGLLVTHWEGGKLAPFKQMLRQNTGEGRVRSLAMTPGGILFAATHNGLYAIDTKKETISDRDFAHYSTSMGNFPNDEVRTITFADGHLWAGVAATGVVKCNLEKGYKHITYTVINKDNGLADNDVRSSVSDGRGHVWVGCESGLSSIDTHDDNVHSFTLSNNSMSNAFAENSAMLLSDGRLLFGTEEGVLLLSPQQVKDNRNVNLQPIITNLLIDGVSIYEQNDSTSSASVLSLGHKVKLSYDQNTVTICYSNFNYHNPHSQLYQVRLEGSGNGWSRPTTSNLMTFVNLDPGSYRFHVRAFDGKKWSKATVFDIRIRQPWYNSWWAWLIYLLAAGVLTYVLYRNTRTKIRLHQQVAMEKQLSEFRLNFFTQIAHEFRTPLSIIQSGVYQLMEPNSKHVSRSALSTIERGTHRLLRMVNQLMEFRRVNTHNQKLQVARGDLIVFVRNVWQDLWNAAEQKDIRYTFKPFAHHFDLLFDPSIVESVVYNLLSNALKYVPPKGTVTLRIAHEGNDVLIVVEDNGPGISPEQREQLFKPFMHGYVSRGGMGIGLYTASQLAQVHLGHLDYEPTSSEGGARFTFVFPASDDAYSQAGMRKEPVATASGDKANTLKEGLPHLADAAALNDQTVAIIEDDPDMLQQMKELLGYYFHILGYSNGKEGFEGVTTQKPDLVVCDVRLPDMEGFEIVRRLKADNVTADIPVILLTALDDEQHQIKAYQSGADDYMVKPCNYRLLIARIIQLMKKRKMAQSQPEHEGGDQPAATPTVIDKRVDKVFKESVEKLVMEHLSDPQLSVEMLAEKMGMGRTKFFGKMKDLFGMPPNKYIMNLRMETAARLILEGKLSISEISFQVGIESPSYFYRIFKSKYGVSPSKYGK